MAGVLDGKVALVTGAAMGFGWGIARGLAREGARVCIVDVSEEELRAAAADVTAEGEAPLSLVVDVADAAAVERAVTATVDRWGRLDLLVGNAAIMPLVPFEETTPELWARIVGVNLTGVYNGVRAAWPHMRRQGGGHCVAIASGASVRGFRDEVAYCTAKHGLEGFTRALAMEAEPYNIAVNTMGPGKPIKRTSVTRETMHTVPEEERARWVDPIVMAPAFVWLALQPAARYTGLRFDAGRIADSVAAEGYDFAFAPDKVTSYPVDLAERIAERARWTTLK